jgi:AraC-like DNA-binding protein
MNTDVLKNLLLEKLPSESVIKTKVDGLDLFRIDKSFKKKPQLYNPQIILLAQGRKRIFLGDKQYEYDPLHYYVQTVPLPVECEALIEEGNPMLGLVLTIDPQLVGEIIFEAGTDQPVQDKVDASLYDATITEDIIDAAIRLVKTLNSSSEVRFLGHLYKKELLFKIIGGEHGEILKELAMKNRGFLQISKVINLIHEHYSNILSIQDLAKETGMSSTAFHATFKTITNTSPLQYIKNVRLHKARELIHQMNERANMAALAGGYESVTQFNREYKRFFGITPGCDRKVD